MELAFVGRVVEWRGPAPYYYVVVPDPVCADLEAVSASVTYGWGVLPVEARIGETDFRTSLFPKDGGYLLPLRAAVRRAEAIGLDDEVAVQLRVQPEAR